MAEYGPETAEDHKPDDGNTAAKPDQLYTRYWREIERYNRRAEAWVKVGREAVSKYEQADRANKNSDGSYEDKTGKRQMAVHWSNVETLKPNILAKVPKGVVSRRFRDEDPVGRVAAEILERCSNTTADMYGFEQAFKAIRDDRLLPGRGVLWARYEATWNDIEAQGEEGDEDYQAAYKKFAAEKVCLDHVYWEDFGHVVKREWAEVWLVWRVIHKTKDECVERFGKEIAGKLTYDVKPRETAEGEENEASGEFQCALREVWDKRRRRMCFVVKDYPHLIEDGPPPIQLHNFFPCPEPCYATRYSSLFPRADYCYVSDQLAEIDDLTAKIAELSDWLIVKGFIPGGPSQDVDALVTLLKEKSNSVLVPIADWEGYTERGGARQIDWLPLDIIVQALDGCVKARAELIQNVYLLTGISDIMRGQTDPDETKGAQDIKNETGARRVRNAKDEVGRFCRDTFRIVCEIIAEMFRPETLAAMSGFKYDPQKIAGQPMQGLGGLPGVTLPGGQQQPQPGQQPGQPPNPMVQLLDEGEEEQQNVFGDDVVQRLRDDRIRSYSIDIETDSTVQADEQMEKQSRIEFADMLGTLMEQMSKLFTLGPVAAPLAPVGAETLKFVSRGFRAGRTMEETIDRQVDKMLKLIKLQASQPPPPSEEEIKAKGEEARQQREAKNDEAKFAQSMQESQQKQKLEADKMTMEFELAQQEHAMKLEMMEMEMAIKRAEHELALERMAHERQTLMVKGEALAKGKMNGTGGTGEGEGATA